MILAAFGSLAFIASIVIYWRRAVEMRAIRWQLYKLRDDLRREALADRKLLSSDVFKVIDAALTGSCARLDQLSLWTVLPIVLFTDRERIEGKQRHFETRLHQPQHAALLPIYEHSSTLLARHLAWRHMFLSTIAIATIIGFWGCHFVGTSLSKRILSDAVRPLLAPSIVPAVAA
jgi:hypothetical protein